MSWEYISYIITRRLSLIIRSRIYILCSVIISKFIQVCPVWYQILMAGDEAHNTGYHDYYWLAYWCYWSSLSFPNFKCQFQDCFLTQSKATCLFNAYKIKIKIYKNYISYFSCRARSSVPLSMQASKSLLLKAMQQAEQSVATIKKREGI